MIRNKDDEIQNKKKNDGKITHGENRNKKKVSLFQNNRFMAVFSVVIALTLWFLFTLSSNQDTYRIIYDVPIEIALSDSASASGLKIFSQSHTTATIEIKGNGWVINQLTKADFVLKAPSASSINQSGSQTLPLELIQNKFYSLTNYETKLITPSSISVLVDYYINQKSIPIISEISTLTQDGYIANTPILSQDSITISGPESDIDKIHKLVAVYNCTDKLTQDQTITAQLLFYDKYGMDITEKIKPNLDMSATEIEVTIPVQKKKEIPLSIAESEDKPKGITKEMLDSRVYIEDQVIQIAASEDVATNLHTIKLEAFSFSQIDNKLNLFPNVDILVPLGSKNISNIYTTKVTVDFSDYKKRTLTVTKFNLQNVSANKSVEISTKKLNVDIIGPASQIDALSHDDLIAIVDMNAKNSLGHIEMPVKINIYNSDKSWIYRNYKVNVNIVDKTNP